MSCAAVEILICDYLDGTLSAAQKAEVERHLSGCPACAELARDAGLAVSFMERAADVEPPPELLARILLATSQESKLAPRPWRRTMGMGGWIKGAISQALRPKLAMSMAMTIFSFAMLAKFIGMQGRQLQPADFSPARVWAALDDRAYRAWQRTVKFYESIRLVYQIQSQLSDWSAEQQEDAAENADGSAAQDESRRLPVSAGGPAKSEQGTGKSR